MTPRTRRVAQVSTWGDGSAGRLGHGAWAPTELASPTPIDNYYFGSQPVARIALGWRHALALTHAGLAYSWGGGARGQTGHGGREDTPSPRLVEALAREHVAAIGAGAAHSLAATRDSVVFAWGAADAGQLGVPAADVPKPEPSAEPAAARWLEPGSVEAPVVVGALWGHGVVGMDGGAEHSAFVTRDGRVLLCGDDSYGQRGDGEIDGGESEGALGGGGLVALAMPRGARARSAACGAWHTLVLAELSEE